MAQYTNQRNGTVEKPVVMSAWDCAGTNPQSMADKKEKLMLRKLTAQSSSSLESRPLQSQCERLNGIESMQHNQPNPKITYVPNIHKIPIKSGYVMAHISYFWHQFYSSWKWYIFARLTIKTPCLLRCSAERARASPFFFFFFCSLSLYFLVRSTQPNTNCKF